MRHVGRVGLVLAIAIVLENILTVLSIVAPIDFPIPHVLLPLVVYLAITVHVPLVLGASTAFALGVVADASVGYPIGPETFIAVLVFLLGRVASVLLSIRTLAMQIALVFGLGVVHGLVTIALRATFGRGGLAPGTDVADVLALTLLPAASTALVSPLIFSLSKRFEGFLTRRHDEAQVRS